MQLLVTGLLMAIQPLPPFSPLYFSSSHFECHLGLLSISLQCDRACSISLWAILLYAFTSLQGFRLASNCNLTRMNVSFIERYTLYVTYHHGWYGFSNGSGS
jgi:hypothetical protein